MSDLSPLYARTKADIHRLLQFVGSHPLGVFTSPKAWRQREGRAQGGMA
jgi:hypothetical protein